MNTAKIFWSGRSQAVRLPKNFRFESELVRIRRHGTAVILEPISENWEWLDVLCQTLDNEFIAAVNEEPEQQKRQELDEFFK
jgi:antitoxin VapB